MSNHPIVHIEIPSDNPQATSTFYKNAFDWNIQIPPGFEDYPMFQAEGGPAGGFNTVGDLHGVSIKPGDVLIYISTDNIEASLASVEKHGGKTLVGKTEIPQVGWFAIFSDPAGNKIGLFNTTPAQ